MNQLFLFLAPTALPVPMQNENDAALILKAVKAMDDPAIFVQWNANGFNDTKTPNVRNGGAGQTLQALINYITGSGGADFNGQHSLFIFRTAMAITQCQVRFPQWYENFVGIFLDMLCFNDFFFCFFCLSGRNSGRL